MAFKVRPARAPFPGSHEARPPEQAAAAAAAFTLRLRGQPACTLPDSLTVLRRAPPAESTPRSSRASRRTTRSGSRLARARTTSSSRSTSRPRTRTARSLTTFISTYVARLETGLARERVRAALYRPAASCSRLSRPPAVEADLVSALTRRSAQMNGIVHPCTHPEGKVRLSWLATCAAPPSH